MAEIKLSWVFKAMDKYIDDGGECTTEWDRFQEEHLFEEYRIVNDLEEEEEY